MGAMVCVLFLLLHGGGEILNPQLLMVLELRWYMNVTMTKNNSSNNVRAQLYERISQKSNKKVGQGR